MERDTEGARGRRVETQRCAHARLARQQASLEPKWLHSLFIEPGEQGFAIFICDIDLTVSDCQRTHPVTQWDEITRPQLKRPASQGPDSIKATRNMQTHIHVFNKHVSHRFTLYTHTQRVTKFTWDPWIPTLHVKHFRHTHIHTAVVHMICSVALKIWMNHQSDTPQQYLFFICYLRCNQICY